MIPPTVHSSVRSGAERRIFRAIERAPRSEDWVCLHSLGLARHSTKRRAEIDFLLLCRHGIFVLEVKGGGVRREDGVWYFTDRFGTKYSKREGPFDQASGAMFALEKVVSSRFEGTRIADVMLGYGVVMPDVEFSEVGSEADPDLVYDIKDRRHGFDRYVDRLAEFTRSVQPRLRRGLNNESIAVLIDFLRPDFDLVPSAEVVIDDTGERLEELTREQYAVLDAIGDQKRIVVEGAAGTGKTLLALEAARRSARYGKSTLLMCYNRNLAAHLSVAAEYEEYRGSLCVRTLHSLCHELIINSSLRDEFVTKSESCSAKILYDELYPEYAALAVCEDSRPPFDMLIVDESQDILNALNIEVLDGVVNEGLDSGAWQFYLDSNIQASVYGRMDDAAFGRLQRSSTHYVLTLNCRNTRPIAYHTAITSQADRPTVARADGPPVEFVVYDDSDSWVQKLREILVGIQSDPSLCKRSVVLVPKIPNESVIDEFGSMGIHKLTAQSVPELGKSSSGGPYWSTVSGFKGLESDVVVLAGIEDIGSDWWRAVTYVGMSRANVRLVVLISEQCEKDRMILVEERLRQSVDESEAP